jgi:hypothetical protein
MLWRAPLPHFQIWNRIAQDVAAAQETTLVENARLFAHLNMALNDGLQTSFASKYYYALWRPVTAIHNGGLGGANDTDGNPDTVGDPTWLPLHPSTPPYPTYAGNAATIGAAGATVLADVFGDAVGFQISWERYGFAGVTRSYAGFWAAADEEARSRIYGGIHFSFDSVAGQGIGVNVGAYVVDNYLLPRGHGKGKHEGAGLLCARGPSALLAPTLFEGRDHFSHLAVIRAPLGGQTPTVNDRGWLVALTPWTDSECTPPSDPGVLSTRGCIDLRTVQAPEIGHLLGQEHAADGVRIDPLATGIRRMPGSTDVNDWSAIVDVLAAEPLSKRGSRVVAWRTQATSIGG